MLPNSKAGCNLYDIIEVQNDATSEEISKAIKKKIVTAGFENTLEQKKLNNIKSLLMDDKLRLDYDLLCEEFDAVDGGGKVRITQERRNARQEEVKVDDEADKEEMKEERSTFIQNEQ